MKKKEAFTADPTGIQKSVHFCETFLKEYSVDSRELIRATLSAEEAITSLVEHSHSDTRFTVLAKASLGTVTLEITGEGEEYDLCESIREASVDYEDEVGDTTRSSLRNILLKAYANNLKYRHKAGVNSIRMTVVKSRHAFLYRVLGAMILGLVVGVGLSALAGRDFNLRIDTYLLSPISTMFMNALKMVVAPVVFFSIISCIVQFSDLTELGRIGGKVFGLYLCTTVIAVGVGFGVYMLLQPGGTAAATDIAQTVDSSSITSQQINVSILDMIVNIVPSNFVQPFLQSDMLQLIFLAVVAGVAVGMIGKYSQMVISLIEAFNELFLNITNLIIKAMPIAVFCSIASMAISIGADSFISVLGMFGTNILGTVIMMVIYCLMMLVLGRINPIPFLKKYAPTMLQIFSMSSSNASIPLNMEVCDKKLGIDKKVYSLSIPLGATVNMDGTCVSMAVFVMALAKVYSVELSGAAIASLIVSIIILSIGSPGIPGSGLICLSVLLTQIGVPIEAVGLVMGIDPLAGMFRTVGNCLGDVAVTTVVARTENALDMDVYRQA